jgi:hypothetical protein
MPVRRLRTVCSTCWLGRPVNLASLSLFDLRDGLRYQANAGDTPHGQLAHLEARHRAHARVEDRIRCGKTPASAGSRPGSSRSTRPGSNSHSPRSTCSPRTAIAGLVDADVFGGQPLQTGTLGKTQDRREARARHQVGVIEDRRDAARDSHPADQARSGSGCCGRTRRSTTPTSSRPA